MDWWAIAVFISVVRLFLGPQWHSARVGVAESPRRPLTSAGEPKLDFLGSLTQALCGSLADRAPPITWAADIAGISPRTLQRCLARHERTYSQVVDEVRFELARQLLRESGTTAHDVSRAVGYSDHSHFTRAFRRVVGLTPQEYRRLA
jgi:AraC-like DNA-binding protein